MDKLKKNLPVILLSAICTLLLVIVILLINNNNVFNMSNKSDKEEKEKNNTKEVEKIKDNLEDYTKSSDEEIKVDLDKEIEVKDNTSTNTTQPKVLDTVFNSENDLIAYYQKEETSINSSDQTVGQKAKSVFVDVIDFIFYDKEIKGYTFKGLTNTAKLKIITVALKVDNKIDSYFPGYKSTISEKYRNVKEKLAEAYAKYTVNLCEKVGDDTCNQFKEDFATMKENFGITGDYLKEGLSKLKDSIKSKYENWRDK